MTAPPPENWTILKILTWTTDFFRDKGVSEPRASAEILLAHSLNLSRLDLYLRHDQPLTVEERSRFRDLVRRRVAGEPVAYLTGHREFYSLDFLVTPDTLIPRPETEFLVDAAVEAGKAIGEGEDLLREGAKGRGPLPPPSNSLPQPQKGGLLRGLELGVGSGAVVVALAKELPQFRWLGIDISAAALTVARENVRRQGVADRITLVQADLLAALRPGPRFALMVANLPYVPTVVWEKLPKDIKDFEPAQALKGGADGLDLIRRLIGEASNFLAPEGCLALEVGEGHAPLVMGLLREAGSYGDITAIRDYQRVERVVRARRK